MDTEVKVYRDIFKKDISFWIYVKFRYENFSFHIFIVQLLLTIWKRTTFCLKKYGSFKRSSTCCVRYVPSDLKKDGKVRKLERYITKRSIPV